MINKEKKFFRLTPFKMQVIQSFPFIDADFDALTNYELLCKVVEYLNITVDNVNLLNDDFVTLYNYVHDYFDNLDVQDEINNKLDAMAESGQLEEIIAAYLGAAGVLSFNSVADMKAAINLVDGSTVRTLGYYNVNDGGGALYSVRTITNSDVVDNGSIISLHDNTLVAELINDNIINVKNFGAYGDNSHNDTTAFTNAITYIESLLDSNKIYILEIPTGIYKINETIHLNYYVRMRSKGFVEIIYDSNTGTAISIDDVLLKNIDFEEGLYESPIISGKNGGLRIYGKGRDTLSIGVELGGDTASSSTTQKIRNGIEYIQIERFGIGLKFGTNNNYWNHFVEVTFTNNLKGLSIGSDSITSISNTDENISFDKCIFGGNSYAIYEQAPTIFKFYKTSFDMNETLYYTDNGGKLIGFYGCWIERNGLKKFIDTIPATNKAMFLNVSETSKQIIINDSYITYGGEDEGVEITNYLIRGLFTINMNNNHFEVGLDFTGGGTHRLFLTDSNAYIYHNGLFAQNMNLARQNSYNIYSEFSNAELGALPTTATQTFGDFTVTRLLRWTGTIENNNLYNENHMLHFTTPGGGYYDILSKKYDCKYGEIIRPLCVFKVVSDYLSANSGLSCRIIFYDEDDNEIETTSAGTINKNSSDQYFTPATGAFKVPRYAVKYAIKVAMYSNTSSAQSQSEQFYIYGVYSFKI